MTIILPTAKAAGALRIPFTSKFMGLKVHNDHSVSSCAWQVHPGCAIAGASWLCYSRCILVVLWQVHSFEETPTNWCWLEQAKGSPEYMCGSIYLVLNSNTLSIMWGPHLVHKRILMIDKQIEHAVDYSSKS